MLVLEAGLSLRERISKATSGAKSALTGIFPSGNRALRASDASGMRQLVDRMLNTPFEAKAIHSGWARQNWPRYVMATWANKIRRSCVSFPGRFAPTEGS